MAYKVTISDGTILEKSIESVTFKADTPPDNSYCMRTYTINSMQITGRIGTLEKTISLYEWSLLPANSPNCYKEIVVEQTHKDQTLRIVKFSKAFVVGYSESYSKGAGFGYFSIFIRQLVGVDIELKNELTQQAVMIEVSNEAEEQSLLPVQVVGIVKTTSTENNRPNFTDIVAKKKVMQDNDIIAPIVSNRAINTEGLQIGAEESYNRAQELQSLRNDWDKRNGTTAVMRAVDNETGEEVLLVATNSPRKTIVPEFEGKLKGNEVYIGGEGHAEQTIIENIGDRYTLTEGGSSRNVCKGICQPLIESKGMKLDGPKFRGREDKTEYRQFWKK